MVLSIGLGQSWIEYALATNMDIILSNIVIPTNGHEHFGTTLAKAKAISLINIANGREYWVLAVLISFLLVLFGFTSFQSKSS